MGQKIKGRVGDWRMKMGQEYEGRVGDGRMKRAGVVGVGRRKQGGGRGG